MENRNFYNRKQELKLLKEEFANLQTGKMFVVYGRRRFADFGDFLDLIAKKSNNSFVLVIDEFQRFLEVSPQFITSLQNYWDQKLKNRKILLILVGSSIGMIQKITNSKAGALYGSATKIKISPFKYSDFRLMF